MKIKKLNGERIAVLPDNSDENRTTPSGIILPDIVKTADNNHIKRGIVTKKGTGTPWNRMEDIDVKTPVFYKKGSGEVHEETADDGRKVQYLILKYAEILMA